MEVIKWVIDGLNGNAGAITGIATVVLVGITGYYAHVTRKILDENKQMRLDAQKPNVEIYLSAERDKILAHMGVMNVRLHVTNFGAGTAYDVRFIEGRTCRIHDKLTLEDIPFVSQGISLLPPGQTREHSLGDTFTAGISNLLENQLIIKISYKDSRQKEGTKNFSLNPREHIREDIRE